MISENCGLSKSHVWIILNESGFHPYRFTPLQGLLPRDAERRYTWCNFVMNNLEDHLTFPAGIIWTDEACVSRNGIFNRQNIHTWYNNNKIRDMLSKFEFNYTGRLMYVVEFLMTGSLDQYFTRER
ncbi:hypothetical protein AVEN_41458-1 [Araneus ventricosus]|uniref:Uncharacterized protein n=1 Tax=Araneus ventricosus TaxID=182803 RepID=A0A4Y2F071_ARAVE|nr:hypothetical protein AVEN_41458-1 [Araneus ventricosus]